MCGGTVEAVRGKKQAKCPYCDSVFDMSDEIARIKRINGQIKQMKHNQEKYFNKPEWFDYQVKSQSLIKGNDTKEALKAFTHCIDDLGNSDAIINYIKTEMPAGTGIYHEGNKPDKFNAFLKKPMKGQLSPGENAIFYANTAFFSCGKEGILVTDRKIVFASKKQVIAVQYNELNKMALTVGVTYIHIHLNDIHNADINCIEGSSLKPYGALAALISTFSFEQNPGRDKIIICKYDGRE